MLLEAVFYFMEITPDILAKLAPSTKKPLRDRFLPFLNDAMPRFGITTELRIAAFLATCAVESAWFRTTEEYGKGKGRYYGKPDPVTGQTYYGRGIIQLTHKAGYQAFNKFVQSNPFYDNPPDFVQDPDNAAELFWAVESACWYWQENKLNSYADKGKFFAIQGLVNKGNAAKEALDYPERLATYEKALRFLPDNFSFDSKVSVTNPIEHQAIEVPIQPTETPAEIPPVDSLPTDSAVNTVTADSAGNVELKQESTILGSLEDKASKFGDTAEKAQGVLSKFGDMSLGSILMQIWKQILGVLTLAVGFFYNNPEWVAVAVVFFIIAAYLWNESRKRRQAEKFALVGLNK